MRKWLVVWLAAFVVVAAGSPLLAHHTLTTEYDMSAVTSVVGTVTEIDWRPPHVLVHLAENGGTSNAASWVLETRAPSILKGRKMEQDTVKVGTLIHANVYVAKNGDHKAWVKTIVLPDGTMLLLY